MLGLSVAELEAMPYGDFLLIVESNLLMEDERRQADADSQLPFHALFTAFNMQATGNMKKSFDPLETALKLYPSEVAWGEDESDAGKKNKDYKTSKEDLLNTFEIEE